MPQNDLPTSQNNSATPSKTLVILSLILTITAIGISFYALYMIRHHEQSIGQTYRFTSEQAQRLTQIEQSMTNMNQEQNKMITGLSMLDQAQKNTAIHTQKKEEQALHWLIKDATYTINAAAQQLYIFGDVQQAAGQLKNLADYLADSNDVRLLPLRQTLNKDIETLTQYRDFDATATHLRLAQLSQTAATIRFHLAAASSKKTDEQPKDTQSSSTIPTPDSVIQHLTQSLKELVQIRTLNRPETIILTPDQQFLFQQNIDLALLYIALLIEKKDFVAATDKINDLQQKVGRITAQEAPSTAAWLNGLQELRDTLPKQPIPLINDSLSMVQALKTSIVGAP